MQHNYISMTGHHLTEEPIYSVKVRIKGDVIEVINGIGIDDAELLNMINEDHYAEITFENTYLWARDLLEVEKDLVQNVKYYLIDNNTMLCVSEMSKRVYVLGRLKY